VPAKCEPRHKHLPYRSVDTLCNIDPGNRCIAQVGDTPLYFDDDHLSAAGAGRVVKQIMGALR
jgi:hypothetical protein